MNAFANVMRSILVAVNFALLALLTYVGIKHYVHNDSIAFWKLIAFVVFARLVSDTLVSLFSLVRLDVDEFVAENSDDDPPPPTSAA
jgi:hypothetical protein